MHDGQSAGAGGRVALARVSALPPPAGKTQRRFVSCKESAEKVGPVAGGVGVLEVPLLDIPSVI